MSRSDELDTASVREWLEVAAGPGSWDQVVNVASDLCIEVEALRAERDALRGMVEGQFDVWSEDGTPVLPRGWVPVDGGRLDELETSEAERNSLLEQRRILHLDCEALRKRTESAEREVSRLREAVAKPTQEMIEAAAHAYRAWLTDALREVSRLREALRKYGQHGACAMFNVVGERIRDAHCDCGLEAALGEQTPPLAPPVPQEPETTCLACRKGLVTLHTCQEDPQ